MLKRDYLIKQFEEFGKVMAIILGLKRDDTLPEFLEEINKAARKYTSSEINYVEGIDNEALLEVLIQEKELNDNQLKMLGDLLFEKGDYYTRTGQPDPLSNNCYKKAFLIYFFLKVHATINYSLDMHYKIDLLSKMNL